MINSNILVATGIIVYIILTIIFIKKQISLKNQFIYLIFFIYIVGVLSVTLFPLPVQKELINDMRAHNYISYNFIPLIGLFKMAATTSTMVWLKQIGGNAILLLPFGFLLPQIFQSMSTFKKVFVAGFISTVGIESLQGLIGLIIGTKYKVVDINDIILNCIGLIIGYGIYKIVTLLSYRLTRS